MALTKIIQYMRRTAPGKYEIHAWGHTWYATRFRSDYGDLQWIIDRDDEAPFAQCDTLACVRSTIIGWGRERGLSAKVLNQQLPEKKSPQQLDAEIAGIIARSRG